MADFATVDDYIAGYPEGVRARLERLRATIRAAAPGAEEKMSYRIPTYALGGRHLVSFAAWKHHVALYPVPAGDAEFERELASYRAARATLRFPHNRPMPDDLVARVVAQLVHQRTA